MIVFGLVSSLFDLMTFGALRWVFRTDASTFQTVWFVISLLTELVVVLVLRTRRLSWKSRPGTLLIGTTAAMSVLGLTLPFVPGIDRLFGFETLSWQLAAFALALVGAYALATELMKRVYYARRR
jgi:Mg2+-importing ATPase